MGNFVVLSHTVFAHVGPKNLEYATAPPPWDGGMADPLKHATHHVLSYQIWSLVVKPFGRTYGVLKILGTLGPRLLEMRAWMTPRIKLLPRVSMPNLVTLCQTIRA